MISNCIFCNASLKEKRLSNKSKFCSEKCKESNKDNLYYKSICPICNKEFISKQKNSKYCDDINCKQKVKENSKENLKKLHEEKMIKKYGKDVYYKCPSCKICGQKSLQMFGHVTQTHHIKFEDYKKQYNISENEIFLPELKQLYSDKIKGSKNPAYQHGGKFSPYSKKFIKYKNENNDVVCEKIQKLNKQLVTTRKENNNESTSLIYWTSRGYSEDEAKIKVRDRNSFTKEKCITKYGKAEGLKHWQERQDKWQNTLKSKSPEEIERINKAKFSKNLCNKGYSNVSQDLFWKVYNIIKKDIVIVNFATFDCGIKNENINNEKCFIFDDKSVCFFDFYIPSLNKAIEFYGDYWHGEKRGNKERDKNREEKIIKKGIKLLIIYEKEYSTNPEKVVDTCIRFIYEN